MFKKQKWQARILSFLLASIMVLQDGAAMAVRADEKSTGTVKTVQENTDTAGKDSGKKDADTAGGDSKNTDAGSQKADSTETPDTKKDADAGDADGKGDGTDTSDSEADTGKDKGKRMLKQAKRALIRRQTADQIKRKPGQKPMEPKGQTQALTYPATTSRRMSPATIPCSGSRKTTTRRGRRKITGSWWHTTPTAGPT